MPELQPAALDTSFWAVGHQVDVLPYLFSYFAVQVPPAVRREILDPDPRFPLRRYGYGEWFRLLDGCGLLHAAIPTTVGSRFGRGEAEALALAEDTGWRLLINDHRPHAFAHGRNLRTVSVPSFVWLLYQDGIISLANAERKLDIIAPSTSPTVLAPVRSAIDHRARERKER